MSKPFRPRSGSDHKRSTFTHKKPFKRSYMADCPEDQQEEFEEAEDLEQEDLNEVYLGKKTKSDSERWRRSSRKANWRSLNSMRKSSWKLMLPAGVPKTR